jgi:HSP20 family protein
LTLNLGIQEQAMAERQQLQVQKKREQEKREETTIPARVFVPTADIYETKDALTVILEMPGVEKNNVNIGVQDGVLNVEGRLDLSKYQGLQPLHIEYNIGHYSRSFQLSSKIDQGKIEAAMKDGVLSLTLPKVEEAKPRMINVR